MLQKSDVLPRKKCWDEDCPVCKTEEGGICNKENIGYSIICQTCVKDEDNVDKSLKEKRHIMHGETNRTARIRCLEHKEALDRKRNSNLWEHVLEAHGGRSEEVEFGYKVERKFHRDSLMRQIEEAWRLENEEGSILNDKLEFRQPFCVQVKATRMQIN